MNNDSKVKQEQLNDWYQGMPKNKLREVRKAVVHNCGISNNVFYNWLAGISPIPTSAQIIINDMAGETHI